MPFPYKTVLITGATSGIGLALAERMIAADIFVVAVGRRKDRLDALVARHGADKVAGEEFDVSAIDELGEWATKITASYPKLDSIILNAGLQRTLDFTKPQSISLATVTTELNTNYLSPVHTIAHFLPHLVSLGPDTPTSIVIVSSGLAVVPHPRCPGYNATKAALHSLAWCLRSQLSTPASPATHHIRVIELLPPAVQTELHSQQPDVVAAGMDKIGVLLDIWADETWAWLQSTQQQGEKDPWADEHMIAMASSRFGSVEAEKREKFLFFEDMLRKGASLPKPPPQQEPASSS